MTFAPTAAEAADIAIQKSRRFSGQLRAATIALGLTNIRTIQKAQRLLGQLDDLIPRCDVRTLEVAVRTVALGCAARFQTDDFPSLKYVTKFKPRFSVLDKKPDPNAHHAALLQAYGYSHSDNFDKALLKGVKIGAFPRGDVTELRQQETKSSGCKTSIPASRRHGSFSTRLLATTKPS